jgi:hypothetical protein
MNQRGLTKVDYFGAFLGEVFSIIAVLIICSGVYKLFQMSGDLREVKELLQDIKRNTHTVAPARPSGPMTPEELVRAVHSGSYDDSVPLEPTVVSPEPRP